MSKKIVKALIKGVVAIAVAVIGIFAGIRIEQRNTQTQINEVMGNVINVNGDDNDITINDIENFMQNYIQLKTDYESIAQQKDALVEQSTKYFNELITANNTIDELNSGLSSEINNLKSQLDSAPVLNYRNLALSIDVDDIPINPNKSMVTIDGRDYFSREIVENLLPENRNLTIKDGTMFIGQVVVDKASLFDQRIFEQSGINIIDTVTDSYGNNYSNVLCVDSNSYYTRYITYYTSSNFSYLRFSVAIRDNADANSTGILTIKADNEVVYTSETLNKKTKKYDFLDLAINNCEFITIEYTSSSSWIDCIISDAVLYNWTIFDIACLNSGGGGGGVDLIKLFLEI